MKRLLFVSLLFSAALVSGVRAALEFSGYLQANDGLRFVVMDLETQEVSRWLKLGDEFRGHKLTRFDPKDEILTLDHAGAVRRLALKTSRIKETKSQTPKGAYRGQPMPYATAKQLIASDPAWQSDVSYGVFRANDGTWALRAMQRVGKELRVRFLPLIAESIPPDVLPQK
jgi:hypothetical protein